MSCCREVVLRARYWFAERSHLLRTHSRPWIGSVNRSLCRAEAEGALFRDCRTRCTIMASTGSRFTLTDGADRLAVRSARGGRR
jgi:hypothetical protein